MYSFSFSFNSFSNKYSGLDYPGETKLKKKKKN